MSGARDTDVLTDAINAAGIHKYLSKDWDAERLRTEVGDAYVRRRKAQS
jgi:response regulator RpfG family c-di-GMP phosphodiesterase